MVPSYLRIILERPELENSDKFRNNKLNTIE